MPAAISFVHVRRAAQIIHDGGVVAYPTEGVFGLGCDPDRHEAVLRILTLKERSVTAGLILIAADREQLDGWINPSAVEENALSGPDAFVTWVVRSTNNTPPDRRGTMPGSRPAARLDERKPSWSKSRGVNAGRPAPVRPARRFHPARKYRRCGPPVGNSRRPDRGCTQGRVNTVAARVWVYSVKYVIVP